MKDKEFLLLAIIIMLVGISKISAQQEEPVNYYQMEPLDDSLFIKIQQEVFIDPPDPKAEIIVDLRDPNNQTVAIKSVIYPFLAFKPETRAKIQTYPFKLNLEENINFGSVFTRVIERLKIRKMFTPPTAYQISSTMQYINPFLQIFGGERFGISIKNDIGISIGLGTPYSGPLETNFLEANMHIMGFSGGVFSFDNALTGLKNSNNNNNLYAGGVGYQLSYVIPFGNFLQLSYTDVFNHLNKNTIERLIGADTINSHIKIIEGPSVNWEFRYPISIMGSTRGKVYFGKYLNEWHFGYMGRELTLAGSTFDLRLDEMPKSDIRNPQFVIDLLVQKVFDGWGFSSIAVGPSAIIGKDEANRIAFTAIFVNFRIKVGTSL
ncbi:MAG: hypothetical protein P4L35_05325 [Ignavibacteriaceae bacterium]|nr:hypothetical protein [Ignavibacteriaceae bacterium]